MNLNSAFSIYSIRQMNFWLCKNCSKIQELKYILICIPCSLIITWKVSSNALPSFNQPYAIDVHTTDFWGFKARSNINKNCDLRCKFDFIIPGITTFYYVKKSIRYFGPLIGNKVIGEIRKVNELYRFNAAIRKWKPLDCLCTLCKNFLGNVGFINASDGKQ